MSSMLTCQKNVLENEHIFNTICKRVEIGDMSAGKSGVGSAFGDRSQNATGCRKSLRVAT